MLLQWKALQLVRWESFKVQWFYIVIMDRICLRANSWANRGKFVSCTCFCGKEDIIIFNNGNTVNIDLKFESRA